MAGETTIRQDGVGLRGKVFLGSQEAEDQEGEGNHEGVRGSSMGDMGPLGMVIWAESASNLNHDRRALGSRPIRGS